MQQRSHALVEHYHSDVRPPRAAPYEEKLMQAFRVCAPLSLPAPALPISGREGIAALSRETWLQCRDGLIALLCNNYDWKEGKLFEELHISDASSLSTNERYFHISLSGKNVSEEDKGTILAAVEKFKKNASEAMQSLDGIAIVESAAPDLLSILYYNERTFWLLNNMIEMHHPDDGEARSHLFMATHMLERLGHNAPANSLC